MKKIALLLLTNLLVSFCFAQNVWNSSEFDAAQKKYNEVKKNFNRIRITSRIFSYNAIRFNSNEDEIPGECFPMNPNAKQQESHALAFINSHDTLLKSIKDLIKYLNDNTSPSEEW